MKKIVLLAVFFSCSSIIHSQILKKISEKVVKKANDKIDKKIDNAGKDNKDETPNTQNESKPAVNNSEPVSLKTYSKYDFVPGERIIWFEDFATDAIGDLPLSGRENDLVPVLEHLE